MRSHTHRRILTFLAAVAIVISTAPVVPVASGATVTLVGAGDISTCGSTGDTATANLISGLSGTVFTAGDNAYNDGGTTDYANCYNPTWGAFKSRTRPAPGNHEYHTPGAPAYFAYFGTAAGPSGLGYYAYTLGTWRIYSLNSEIVSSGELTWLKNDLAANPALCVMAYWHHPLFSSGQHGNDAIVKPFWDALYSAGAELIINGHDHDYERFAPQTPAGAVSATGIREVVVGTGGAAERGFSAIRPNSEVRDASSWGVISLSLSAAGYTGQFLHASGSFTDSFSGTCHGPAGSGPTVTRLVGANRYDTAAKLSQQKTPTPGVGVAAVYIATGLQFPDALAGAPAAHGDNASILLVQQNLIPNETKAELTRLKPLKIYVLGGSAVISNAIATALDGYDRGGGVQRLSGANRYGTAGAIVVHAFPAGATSVIIANGTNFPDALAGGAAAAANGIPMLLTAPTSLAAETTAQLNRLNPSTIYILGGTVSVSTSIENQLKARGNSPTVIRLAGDDRYETGVAISEKFFTAGGHLHMFVATGLMFPDALAAAPRGEPLLLTKPDALPTGSAPAPFKSDAAEATRLNPASITVLGGPTIISDNVITQLQGT